MHNALFICLLILEVYMSIFFAGLSKNENCEMMGCIFSRALTIFSILGTITLIALGALVATNILSVTPLAITAICMGVGVLSANLISGPNEVDRIILLRERSRWIEFLAQTIGSVALIVLGSLALKNVLSFSVFGYTVIGISVPSYLASGIFSVVDLVGGN